jgi:arylsulfatase A-like enzyme
MKKMIAIILQPPVSWSAPPCRLTRIKETMNINARRILIGGLTVLGGTACVAGSPAKPNILWLLAEDFGPALGCYGQENVSTPNIDQLARDGVRYTHFYTTAPVCSPSRSAFMTGMYATTIGAHQHRTSDKKPLPDGVRPLPDWMRDAGYFTANLKTLPASFGFSCKGKTDWNFVFNPKKAFDSDNWADLKTNQPFMAQINFQETHRNFNAPAKADPAKIELPPYYPDHPVTRQDYANYLDSATELDRKIGLVLAQLEQDGLASNTIVIFMGDNGEAHIRGKQFCYEEGFHVPLLIRWPAAFAAPKQFSKGLVDGRLLESIDLAPTLLAIAGAAVPPKMQGKVFLGDQAGAPKEYVFGARDRCDETAMRIRSVRDVRYRYIRNFTPEVPFLAPNAYKERQHPVWNLVKELNAAGKLTPEQAVLCAPRQPEEELYDLQNDPHEIRNLVLSDRPEHQAALKRLRGVLGKWIEDSDDQGRFPEVIKPKK